VPVISVPDELLEDLKKDKPNVVFGDFEDWAKRDLE